MRFAFGLALVFSVGIGAYLGSAQVATSAKPPRRVLELRVGDSALIRKDLQCVAISDSRRYPLKNAYMRCSKRPAGASRFWVDIGPGWVDVWTKGSPKPLYAYRTP
ncbi:MAG TPA: hypothetical protein VMB53_12605 [Gaiellaceae bacterium]|nr:hypothetical protein [Gaiellaceae bacterium]